MSDDLRRREGDLLWRVRLGATWLYVQLEFQSTVDPTIAWNLFGPLGHVSPAAFEAHYYHQLLESAMVV